MLKLEILNPNVGNILNRCAYVNMNVKKGPLETTDTKT